MSFIIFNLRVIKGYSVNMNLKFQCYAWLMCHFRSRAHYRVLEEHLHPEGAYARPLPKARDRNWFDVPEESGLTHSTTPNIRGIDHILRTAFVERCHSETNSFHFSWGR